MPTEWALGDVHDVVSAAIPDRVMLVHGAQRRTYREVNDRSRALARYLVDRGLGVHRERADLARWEAGQDRVAVLAYNTPEHIESLIGCWKARVVPCNVNYQYTAHEVAALLQRVGVGSVIYDRRLRDKLVEIVGSLDVLVEIGDPSVEPAFA